jgi:glutathione S-transferase
MATVKLHRCSWTFLHNNLDSCWKVQKALDDQGVEYEVVTHGYLRGKRPDVVALSGQKLLPVIEFADGTVYRAESADMAARIRAGELAPDGPAAG